MINQSYIYPRIFIPPTLSAQKPDTAHMKKPTLIASSCAAALCCLCIAIYSAPQIISAGAYAQETGAYTRLVVKDISHASQKYVWPTGAVSTVLRKYAPGENNWNPGHRGVDLALGYGQAVYAAGSGTVIYAGKINNREVISIEDSSGIRTTYEPVHPYVHKGQSVEKGEQIGTINAYHCPHQTPCLHWGAKRGSSGYINPLWLLQMPTIRLLE